MRKWNYKCKFFTSVKALAEWVEWCNHNDAEIVFITDSNGEYTVIYKMT
jgi:hypothetical protein